MSRLRFWRHFVGAAGRFTLADVALYAYTHVVGEGGFDLSAYPAIGARLTRIAALRGRITLNDRLRSVTST